MTSSPQIPLRLEPNRSDRLETFVAGPNEAVVEALTLLLNEPGGSVFLSGPEGSGKTHLLNAMCAEARDRGMAAFYFSVAQESAQAGSSLMNLQHMDLVCLDDIDRVIGNAEWEQALFRCFNELHAARVRLLIASRQPLFRLPVELTDLRSRLAWGLRLCLSPPGDADKIEILKKHAETQGLKLPAEVGDYLIRHGKRDMGTLLAVLDELHRAALSAKRRMTVPLARQVLSELGGNDRP